MAEITLRPNAAGDLTTIQYQYPSSTSHYDKVDEASADDATTYVSESDSNGEGQDLYNLPASGITGIISGIVVYVRTFGYLYGPSPPPQHRILIKTHSTQYDDSWVKDQYNWITYSKSYATNPYTSAAWTIAEIDALQIGVGLLGYWASGPTRATRTDCTQCYVTITYTPTQDSGVRIYTSGGVKKVAAASSLGTESLRVYTGSGVKGIKLVTTDAATAIDGLRVYDGADVKCLEEYT